MKSLIKKIGLVILMLSVLSCLPWLLIFLNAWLNKPDIPLAPPRYPALSATFEINGKPYRIRFTWTEENYQQWNEGQGWNTRWKSSHRTCVKILNDQYAMVIWLPHANENDLLQFCPTFALIERHALQSLRIYRKMKSGEKRDDILGLSELNIEQDPKGNEPKPMTQEEESLWNILKKRSYGYLCAWTYEKEHWSRSEALTQMFSQMKEVTPLSTWKAGYQQQSAFWKALVDFRNSNIKLIDQRPLIGFQCENGNNVWKLLPYSDVLVYSESLSNKSARTFVSFSDRQIETRENELLFDAPKQRIVDLRHIGKSRLDDFEP